MRQLPVTARVSFAIIAAIVLPNIAKLEINAIFLPRIKYNIIGRFGTKCGIRSRFRGIRARESICLLLPFRRCAREGEISFELACSLQTYQ